jgi:hypothetical protein
MGSASARMALGSRSRIGSLVRLITALLFEVELFAKPVAGRLRTRPGYQAIQVIPGIGPVLVGVFVAEIGHITRFGARAVGLLGRADPETMTPDHGLSDLDRAT